VQGLLIEKDTSERNRIAGLLLSLGLDCDTVGEVPDGAEGLPFESPGFVIVKASKIADAQNMLQRLNHGKPVATTPIVICYTDSPRVDEIAACILAGAADVLVNPFNRDVLRFKLEQAGLLPH